MCTQPFGVVGRWSDGWLRRQSSTRLFARLAASESSENLQSHASAMVLRIMGVGWLVAPASG